MVAYSFKCRFVEPIRWGLGLGLDLPNECVAIGTPKRQTIRADRKRHARPGEEVQLYHGMRTRQCFLIGKARCTSVLPIIITEKFINIAGVRCKDLDHFARTDGFEGWGDMLDFWREVNQLTDRFTGVIIYWEPLRP